MNLARIRYRLGIINYQVEFLFILGWALFFPFKDSHLYFFGFALIMGLILLKNIYSLKTIGLSYFSHSLMVFNFALIISLFFSDYAYKSMLLIADIFIISSYFILFYYDRRKQTNYFRLLGFIISFFSLINIFLYVVPLYKQRHLFFISSIHEGIISGMGVLVFFYYLLEKWQPGFFVLLLINLGGVFVSESKAAYLGTVIFFLLLLFSKKKKWLPFLFLFVILTFVIPNPIRSMFYYSVKKDPYALDRIAIWKMSLRIFTAHPLVGVGLDNFAEVSGAYNFKQEHGPANYFKVPHIPHSDYFKLLTELGILGLALILALFFFLVKKMFSSSFISPPGILLLYLLFQALFFNILFNVFFFFILLFLLKNLLEREQDVIFRSFSAPYKLLVAALLIFVWLVGYLFPWLSFSFMEKSKKNPHLVQAYHQLEKAELLNPLDQSVYYLKALYLMRYFKQTANLESFYSTLHHLKMTQRLNPYFIEAYLVESDLYLELLKKKIKYVSMDEEILAPLEKAEQYAPVNPFIKLHKAQVLFEFNKNEKALAEAVKAITLEPDFVAALYFLQKKFNYFRDEQVFRQRIAEILKKAGNLKPEPGHYLYRLYEIPGEYSIAQQNTEKGG